MDQTTPKHTPHAEHPHHPAAPDSTADFVRKFLFAALIVAVMVVVWATSQVFVLGFGGVVVAVILRNMSAPIARHLHVSDHTALVITTLGLGIFAIGFFALYGALAADQFLTLFSEIPGAVAGARKWMQSFPVGHWVLSMIGTTKFESGAAILNALPFAGGVLGGLGEAALVILLGIYLAADPRSYVRGAVRLFPPHRRVRIGHMLEAAGVSLRKWLIGQTLDMLFVGVVTWFGLWMVGVPLSFALGAMTGVSVFVPYIGPMIATVPGILLALSVSPLLALYAAIVYAVTLTIEGNITQPLLQRRAVALSPVINLLAIVGFGVIFGLWGIILATPMTVVLTVLIRMAYVEDVLEARAQQKGAGHQA